MAAKPDLGRIEWIADIRTVWTDEALMFTPWLLDNAGLLGQALGIELDLERAEHPVGGYRLDLIGRDLDHDALLIVENQIEASDHGHLGQLLTYAAGTDAATIVWVARSFRDEHRTALDWLNEHTGEDIRFFGVEVRALRIGESLPAPLFDVVAKPNDWQKTVRTKTQAQVSDERYGVFWQPLVEQFRDENPGLLGARATPRSYWFSIDSPLPRTSLYGEVGANEWRVLLNIDAGSRDANIAQLALLKAFESQIVSALPGASFETAKVHTRIIMRMPAAGRAIEDEAQFGAAREWVRTRLLTAHAVFSKIAPELDGVGG